MDMISMARKPEEAKENDVICCGGDSKYPYGLQISLEEDQLKALGVSEMPKAGSELTLTVKVKVTGCREDEKADGEIERCLSMQITDMASLQKKSMFDHPSRVKGE